MRARHRLAAPIRSTTASADGSHFAVLTDAGREAMRRSWPVYKTEIESRFGDHLTVAQAAAMRDGLLKVLAANGGGKTVESPPVQVDVRKK